MAESILGQIANPPGTNMPERLSDLATARQQRQQSEVVTEAQSLKNTRTKLQEIGRVSKALLDTYYPEGQEQPTNPAQAAKDYFQIKDRLEKRMGVPEDAMPNRIPRRSELQQAFEQSLSLDQQIAQEEARRGGGFTLGEGQIRYTDQGVPIAAGPAKQEETPERSILVQPNSDLARELGVDPSRGGQVEVKFRGEEPIPGKTVTNFEFVGPQHPGDTLSPREAARTEYLKKEYDRKRQQREASRETIQLSSGLQELVTQEDVPQGAIQNLVTPLQNLAQSVGVDLQSFAEGMGINLGDLSKKEEFDRLSKNLLINQFKKFKGNLNSSEVNIARDSVTGLGTSREGNIRALASIRAAAELSERRANDYLNVTTSEEAKQWRENIEEQGTKQYKALRDEYMDRMKAGMETDGREQGGQGGAETQAAPEQPTPEGDPQQFTVENPAVITDTEEGQRKFEQLPEGAIYRHPDGNLYKKTQE